MRVSKKIIEYRKKHQWCEACYRIRHHIHHIKSRGAGGTDDHSNLIALCARCHNRIHTIGHVRFIQEYPHLGEKIYTVKKGVVT